MALEHFSMLQSSKASSHFWWHLLLAACLLVDVATAWPHKCQCRRIEVHTVHCDWCSHVPNILPKGVSRLNMTGNQISHVNFAGNVANLKSVYLGSNKIESLHSGDLSGLESLMVLDLSANNLVSIDEESIASNGQLTQLILDGNPQLQLVALSSRSLRHLYLQNCGLTSFDKRLLRHLPNLTGLYLRGNDELPCEQVVQDLHQDRPQVNVYCDAKTTATKRISADTTASTATASPNHIDTRATAYVPNFVYWAVPSEGLPSQTPDTATQKVQLLVPIPLVPLIVILAVVLVVCLFGFCHTRPGKSGDGRLLEEPC